MRNLKRALSLALASVMLFGMMVVGAGAAQSYPDVDDSYNTEAIDVLKVVNVMSGYAEDGLFHPDDNVNRAMMARIMAELLNLDYDYYEAIPSQFTDVTGNYSWAKKYVDACAANGIIYGRGNGIYDPASSVTAVEAASMMMRALGYFQHIEDNEGNFEAATVKQASQIGLFSGINGNAHDALNRNQIAKLALNTLESNMVYFTGDMGFDINGVKMGYRSEYTYRTGTEAKYSAIHGLGDAVKLDNTTGLAQGQYYVNLGEQLYDGKLKLSPTTDDFYRPSRIWEYDGKEIGTYLRKDLLREEYTVKVTGKELYELLTKETVAKYDFVISIDGETEKDILDGNANIDQYYFTEKNLVRTNTEGIGGTGNGVLTQVFVNPEEGEHGTVYISVINTYFAVAANNYNEKKDQVDLTVYGLEEVKAKVDGVTVTGLVKDAANSQKKTVKCTLNGDEFDIKDIEKDDAFLVNVADNRIVRIGDVTMLENETINQFKTGNYVVTPDDQYDYASTALYDWTVLDNYVQSNMKETVYNLFLDQYGYLIGIEIVDKPTNYLFLAGVDTKETNRSAATAVGTALFLDGTVGEITINLEKSQNVQSDGTWDKKFGTICDAVMNTWCTYTVDKNGTYTLIEVANEAVSVEKTAALQATPEKLGQSRVVENADTAAAYITTGLGGEINKSHPSTNGIAASTNYKTVYGSGKTVYLVAEVKEILANVPYNATEAALATGGVTDKNTLIISGVDSYGVGYQNVDLKAYNAKKAAAEYGTAGSYDKLTTSTAITTSNEDYGKISYGVYNLFDKNGYVIAAVVVGEDQGSNSQYAYVVKSAVNNEGWSEADDKWTWTRDIIINGEPVTLTETNSDNSQPDIQKMVMGAWYEVKYKADGTVKSATPIEWDWDGNGTAESNLPGTAKGFFRADATDTGYKFIGLMRKVEDAIGGTNNFGTVVLSQNMTGITDTTSALYPIDPNGRIGTYDNLTGQYALSHKANTLQIETTQGNQAWDIPMSADAKVVLIQDKQYEKNGAIVKVDAMEYFDYWDNDEDGAALDNLIDELEKNENFVGFVSAVFENGLATSVIVWDQTPNVIDGGDSTTTPGGGTGDHADAIAEGYYVYNQSPSGTEPMPLEYHTKKSSVADNDEAAADITKWLEDDGYTIESGPTWDGTKYEWKVKNKNGVGSTREWTPGSDLKTNGKKVTVDGGDYIFSGDYKDLFPMINKQAAADRYFKQVNGSTTAFALQNSSTAAVEGDTVNTGYVLVGNGNAITAVTGAELTNTFETATGVSNKTYALASAKPGKVNTNTGSGLAIKGSPTSTDNSYGSYDLTFGELLTASGAGGADLIIYGFNCVKVNEVAADGSTPKKTDRAYDVDGTVTLDATEAAKGTHTDVNGTKMTNTAAESHQLATDTTYETGFVQITTLDESTLASTGITVAWSVDNGASVLAEDDYIKYGDVVIAIVSLDEEGEKLAGGGSITAKKYTSGSDATDTGATITPTVTLTPDDQASTNGSGAYTTNASNTNITGSLKIEFSAAAATTDGYGVVYASA